jgi:OHCU decarboxylase
VTAAPTPRLLPIEELNRLPLDGVAEALRPLFEAADPLAARLAAGRPYASYADLLDRAGALVDRMPSDEQIAVVNAHPKIGESATVVRETSALSYREQGYDAEVGRPADQLERLYADLAQMNAAYEARFGFRFVVFVNGRSKAAILEVLRARFEGQHDQELRTALHDMLAIARDRLSKLQ